MSRLRFVLKSSAVILILSVGSLLMLVAAVLTGFRAKRIYREAILASVASLILRVFGIEMVVRYHDGLPSGQVVYIANHSSTIDIFALSALRLPNTRFFLWGGLRKILPIGLMGCLVGNFWTVSQDYPQRRRQLFSRAAGILRQTGESVFLSPEGARITGEGIGHFNKGAFHLATDLRVPIVPIFISIPSEIDPGSGFNAKPGRIQVDFGAPIDTRSWTIDNISTNRDAVRRVYVHWNSQRHGPNDRALISLARTGACRCATAG